MYDLILTMFFDYLQNYDDEKSDTQDSRNVGRGICDKISLWLRKYELIFELLFIILGVLCLILVVMFDSFVIPILISLLLIVLFIVYLIIFYFRVDNLLEQQDSDTLKRVMTLDLLLSVLGIGSYRKEECEVDEDNKKLSFVSELIKESQRKRTSIKWFDTSLFVVMGGFLLAFLTGMMNECVGLFFQNNTYWVDLRNLLVVVGLFVVLTASSFLLYINIKNIVDRKYDIFETTLYDYRIIVMTNSDWLSKNFEGLLAKYNIIGNKE